MKGPDAPLGSQSTWRRKDGNLAPGVVGRLDQWLVACVQATIANAPVRIVLWDGTSAYEGDRTPIASLLVADRRTLVDLLARSEIGFGEAYTDGRLEVQGDLVACLEAIDRAHSERRPRGRPSWWLAWPNTPGRARSNIHHHYDLGNDFYRLWLDDQLVYTCAYFPDAHTDIEAAQVAKMDYVCRKLRLRPGDRVVEAGCGWGALALHMARHYGVSVRAINLSREQIAYARARASAEALSSRVEFIEDDYRNTSSPCDVFVSVGMIEHVGRDRLRELGAVIDRCLSPARGRGLLHFIGRDRPIPLSPWIRKRIFPGAYPPTLAEVTHQVLEPWDLSVLDAENLRLHYARTLAHWLARFETAADRIQGMFDERFVRAWRLYLAGSQAAFATGWLQLFQITFARSRDNDVPLTRADLYRTSGPP